ncbi:hypothetical protein M434DRAFT_35795 [Hypoxylon sp. CO27-5]|nr:hypothetical protein M434DRAFT_35795 [Hypoxylon sp. CO27-5]
MLKGIRFVLNSVCLFRRSSLRPIPFQIWAKGEVTSQPPSSLPAHPGRVAGPSKYISCNSGGSRLIKSLSCFRVEQNGVCNQESPPVATPHFFQFVICWDLLGSLDRLARQITLAPVFPVRMDKTFRSGPPLDSCETNVGAVFVSPSLQVP